MIDLLWEKHFRAMQCCSGNAGGTGATRQGFELAHGNPACAFLSLIIWPNHLNLKHLGIEMVPYRYFDQVARR